MAGLADDLDLALLPGGWGPWLPEDHLNPLTAAKALRLLRSAAHLAPAVDVRVLEPGEATRIDGGLRERTVP